MLVRVFSLAGYIIVLIHFPVTEATEVAEAEMCYVIEGIGIDSKVLKHIRRHLRWNWRDYVDRKDFHRRELLLLLRAFTGKL